MASELRVNTLKDSSGNNPVNLSVVADGSAKMWVSWAYDSGTPDLKNSTNISSITDVGTGDADHNLTNAMTSQHVSITSGTNHSTTGNTVVDRSAADRFGQRLFNASGSAEDPGGGFNATVHGDLA